MDELLNEVLQVIQRAHTRPFSFSSDYARYNSEAVAIAASCGWITCIDALTNYPRPKWLVTAAGLNKLKGNQKWILTGKN